MKKISLALIIAIFAVAGSSGFAFVAHAQTTNTTPTFYTQSGSAINPGGSALGAGNYYLSNGDPAYYYGNGTIPGGKGNAVIDGHVDNGLALAGVFKHLADIQIGTEADIVTVGGETLRFAVSAVDAYDYKNAPAAEIFGLSDQPQIRLVTCGGAWVPGEKTYDERIVVTAVLVR